MGIRVGIPVLKLSRNAKPTKRKGDARKVALEAFNERYSKDQDLDRVQSKNNIYTGFKSGKDLYAYWEKEASGHLDTKGRHLRSDAVIGYTFIIKPDMESMENMTQAERVKFLQESMNILSDLFQSRGLEIDASALHLDEVNEHMHVFGHDVEYKAGKKIDIRLFGMLNKEYPKRMRELGYDVEDLTVYDSEKADNMTEEEKADYKEEVLQRKKAKKNAGRSSSKYKEEKLAEKENELQAREMALNASILSFEEEKEKYWQEAEKERKRANTAFENELKQKRLDAKKKVDAELEKYKSDRLSDLEQEIEKEKSEKLSEFKQASVTAYTAQMDFRIAKQGYEEVIRKVPDLIIRELNQKTMIVQGKRCYVGNFYSQLIKNAVQNIQVSGETSCVEKSAEKSMRDVSQFESILEKMNAKDKSDDMGFGF